MLPMDETTIAAELIQTLLPTILIAAGSLIVAILTATTAFVKSMSKLRKEQLRNRELDNEREALFVKLVEDTRTEQKRLLDRLEERRKETTNLRDMLDEQTRNTNRLERTVFESQQKIDSFIHDIEALNNSLAQSKHEVEQLKAGLELERIQRENIERERLDMLSTLKREREVHSALLETKDNEIRVLNETVGGLKKEVSTLRTRLERLETSTQPVTTSPETLS